MGQDMLEKAHQVRAFNGVVLGPSQEMACIGHGTHDREPLIAEWNRQDRRLSAWGIGPDHPRQKLKTCFIAKHYRLPFLLGFFSTVGQLDFQASTAAWLCCVQPILRIR